jgi:outer membrane protein assembly factor BamB
MFTIKSFIYTITILAMGFGFAACNKTISDDSPLPAVNTPRVLVPVDNQTLYAIDAKTGIKAWEYKSTSGDFACTPVTVDTFVFVTSGTSLIKINGNNGKLIDRYFYGVFKPNATPVYYNDNLYFTVGSGSQDSVFKIDYKDGSIKWRKYTNSAVAAACYINGSNLYVSEVNGHVESFDLNNNGITGSVWDAAIGSSISLPTNLTFANGFMYVVNTSRQVLKLDPSNGAQKWKYDAPKNITSHPIVFGDMVIIGCEDFKVYCLEAGKDTAKTTYPRWVYPTLERIVASACVDKASENTFIGSNDFNLYAINHVTGKLSWKYPVGSIIKTSIVNYNGAVFFTSLDKYCYSVNAKTGELNWKYNINGIANYAPMVNTYSKTNYYPADCGNSEY